MKNLIILDNGGTTYDRYTIIDKMTGDMIGASEQPSHPLGFGQFVGNVADNYWNVAYGCGWRRGCDEKLIQRRIRYAVNLFKNDCSHIGKPVKWDKLPEAVKRFAEYAFSPEMDTM